MKALYAYKHDSISKEELAELSCHIEIDVLNEPIGKQDQFISSFGGIRSFKFNKDGTVDSNLININDETLYDLKIIYYFFTGFARSASNILRDQKIKSEANNKSMLDNPYYVKDLGMRSLDALESGKLDNFGKLMDEHWVNKRKRSKGMSNSQIDDWYGITKDNGAMVGKLLVRVVEVF